MKHGETHVVEGDISDLEDNGIFERLARLGRTVAEELYSWATWRAEIHFISRT
jgi:hypothetical protein